MVHASEATQYIADGLNSLIQSNQLYGKLSKSKSSVSLYLNTKSPTVHPQKSVRASNHHPTLANMVKGRRKPWNTKNISVEFYEQRIGANGKPIKNRTRTTVYQNSKGTIKPFSVTIYEYRACDIEESDVVSIYKAVLGFINKGVYKDPMENTEKEAKVSTKTATIKNRPTTVVTESDLISIVEECIKRIIIEQKGYVDNKLFGWKHLEKNKRDAGATDYDIEQLHKAYNEYGRECAKNGESPNDTGFSMWCTEKDMQSCDAGRGIRYPHYCG